MSREALPVTFLLLAVSTIIILGVSIHAVLGSNCNGTSVPGLVPLNDLENQSYQGFEGGLYPNAMDTMPLSHLEAGISFAKQMVPLDKSGNPSAAGKIVLVSIGMSNTLIETNGLISLAKSDSNLDSSLVIVNGAEGGEDAQSIVSNPAAYWSYVDNQLANAGVTPQQVEGAWLKEADANPSGSQITYAQTLSGQLIIILQMMLQNFPHLKLAYISSRIYAGYASSTLNPEPYAYISGFSVKWTIQAQLNGTSSMNFNSSLGTVRAPWVAWGPYMWANGVIPRSDGLTWICSDFQSDGTHPSIPQGQMKVANMLLNFFSSDPTTRSWFTSNTTASVGGTVVPTDKFALLAPYASTLIAIALVVVITSGLISRYKRARGSRGAEPGRVAS